MPIASSRTQPQHDLARHRGMASNGTLLADIGATPCATPAPHPHHHHHHAKPHQRLPGLDKPRGIASIGSANTPNRQAAARGLVEARSLQRTQGRKVSCIPTPEESDAIFGDVASLMTPRHGISHPSPTVIGVGTTTPGNYTSRVGSKPATNLTSPLHKIFPELKACTHAHQLDLPVPWMGHIGTTGGGATAASNKRNGIRHRSGCRALGTGVFHCECGGQKGLKKLDKARKRSLKQMKKESLLIRKIESQM